VLGWLYWNPSRELFVIPYLDRPVVWYGVFFALGFLISYYLVLFFYREFFKNEPFFVESDISSWSRFLMTLKNQKETAFLHNFLSSLPNPLKEKILQWDLNKEIDERLQKALLFGMNRYIESGKSKKDVRLSFEKVFSCCIGKLEVKIKNFVEKQAFYMILATVIGARLGHIVFYEPIMEYIRDPIRILKTWEGGLASHGAALGIVSALAIFRLKVLKEYSKLNFQKIMDIMIIPTALVGCLIRIGNFFNQEVLGTMSEVPWAIIFGSPADGSRVLPRHPAQLYEAAFYLGLFFVLWNLRTAKMMNHSGRLAGFGLTAIFLFRFCIEFVKEEQSFYQIAWMNMGQLLSLPWIIVGISLFFSERLFSKRSQEVIST
jgi:prolipoprotein diacylglyceryl transferase